MDVTSLNTLLRWAFLGFFIIFILLEFNYQKEFEVEMHDSNELVGVETNYVVDVAETKTRLTKKENMLSGKLTRNFFFLSSSFRNVCLFQKPM